MYALQATRGSTSDGLRLLALMSICWLLVFLLALVTGVAVAVRSADLGKRGVVSLLTPTIGLMTLLWS